MSKQLEFDFGEEFKRKDNRIDKRLESIGDNSEKEKLIKLAEKDKDDAMRRDVANLSSFI